MIAFKRGGFPESLGRMQCCFCSACSLRSEQQKRPQQLSGKSCCALLQASFPQLSASWSPQIVLSACQFCVQNYIRELKTKFRNQKVKHFPCLFASVCNLFGIFVQGRRGECSLLINAHLFSFLPRMLVEIISGRFSETATSLSVVETVVNTQISKKQGGYYCRIIASP